MIKVFGYKKFLFPALLIAAAVLCALPFLTERTELICVYTRKSAPSADELRFIDALEANGASVKLNAPEPQKVAFWFRSPQLPGAATISPAQYNFIYSEEHYPFDWRRMKNSPIILTPHRDLFEHYTRSNLKTAVFDITNPSQAAQRFFEILNWLKANCKN